MNGFIDNINRSKPLWNNCGYYLKLIGYQKTLNLQLFNTCREPSIAITIIAHH